MQSRAFLKKTIRFTVAALLLTPLMAMASDKILVSIPGVPGDSRLKGFEGQLEVTGFSLSATSPAGKAILAPVVVTKPADVATPILMEALGKGSKLGTITLRTLRNTGGAVNTITITDARVVDWRYVDAFANVNNGTEQVSFVGTSYTVQFDQIDPATGARIPGTPRTISALAL